MIHDTNAKQKRNSDEIILILRNKQYLMNIRIPNASNSFSSVMVSIYGIPLFLAYGKTCDLLILKPKGI